MKITILGGAGFLGRKIAAHLAQAATLGGRPVTELTLFDLAAPLPPAAAPFPVHSLAGDLVELPEEAIGEGTDVVFHLAAVVSAAAEADYELGRRVNLRGTDAVVDACRRLARPPRVVFTSSVASFSGGQDAVLGDEARQVPANSYGAQKAAAELILADASRRGFLDAVSIRLPTITVRPGRPNKAASRSCPRSCASRCSACRRSCRCAEHFAVWIASPRRAVDWLLHAAALDGAALGLDRSINPPGHRGHRRADAGGARCGEARRRGPGAQGRGSGDRRHRRRAGRPGSTAARALRLGFAPHEPLVELVRAFVADNLEATSHERGLPD